jgi:hypothetical protein
MTAGITANVDGSAAVQVGGTNVINLTSGGAATFVTSPTTVQAGTVSAPSITFSGDTNTGIYSPGADRIGFTEGGTQVGEFDASGNFLFNSGYGSVATAYGCRAWVNFNGTANTNLSGTYSQSGTTVTVTATAHGLIADNSIYSDITTGTGVDGTYTVATVTDANTFTYTAGTSLTTSGNITLIRSTIRASGNVTTVADNGTGDYTINFTNAMPDINYTVVANSGFLAGPGYPAPVALFANNSTGATVTPTVSAARITTRNSAFNPADVAYITAAVFR